MASISSINIINISIRSTFVLRNASEIFKTMLCQIRNNFTRNYTLDDLDDKKCNLLWYYLFTLTFIYFNLFTLTFIFK